MTDHNHPNLQPDEASMRVAQLADRAADAFRGEENFWTGLDGEPAASADPASYHEFIVTLGGGSIAVRLTPDGTLTHTGGEIILLGGVPDTFRMCLERTLLDLLGR